MASITRVKSGWRVRWRERSGRARSRTCPTRAVAEELRRQVEAARVLGADWVPPELRAEPTLRELIQAYLRARRRSLEPSTLIRVAERLDFFEAYLAKAKPKRTWLASDLSLALLEDFHDHSETTPSHRAGGRRRRPSTVKRHVRQVEILWEWAADREGFEHFVGRPRRIAHELRVPPPSAPLAATWEQAGACVRELHAWRRDVGVLCYYTGLRIRQVMGLEWRDVDLEGASLVVRGELGKSRAERRGRQIPISEHLVAELRTWTPSGAYLVAATGSAAKTRVCRSAEAAEAWARAGVDRSVWFRRPWHAFRRAHATGLRRMGVAASMVDALQGRQPRGAQDRHYVDVAHLDLRGAVDLVPLLELPQRP